jgi:predicted RND superfamily exporter protein
MHPREAVRESVRSRVRPIFMSVTTTLFALSPLVIFSGSGSELYRGIGSVVLGGLLVSTLFTLFVVPALFSLVMDFRERRALGLAASEPRGYAQAGLSSLQGNGPEAGYPTPVPEKELKPSEPAETQRPQT